MENTSHFFAVLNRMKYINRWGLMRNTRSENLCEHSLDVAIIAHALAIIGNRRLNKTYDEQRAAILSLFHDSSEILTGDLPTPVKYFNPEIKKVYHEIEDSAKLRLLSYLPDDMRDDYYSIFLPQSDEDKQLLKLVKAADKISALIKCIEEKKAGNTEFDKAYQTLYSAICDLQVEEADIFMREFLPSYSLTLDEQE